MKKLFIYLILIPLLIGCSNKQETNPENQIKVYARDSASGTRKAFESIINLESLTKESAETNGNGDMAKQIGTNKNAIGYVSLTTDFKNNNLKPLSYEGVQPSVNSVNSRDYNLARPFSYVTRESGDFDSSDKELLVLAILDYMNHSIEGKETILAAGGIVDTKSAIPWSDLEKEHPIVNQDNSHITLRTGGSTSVEKTVTKAISSFIPMAGNFNYEPNYTGSNDGYKRTLGSEKNSANMIDIGFASREFTDQEKTDKALKSGVYTQDAIVVVVHQENDKVNNLNKNQLNDIFAGKTTQWDTFDQ